MDIEKLMKAIDIRRSRRKFREIPIEPHDITKLKQLIEEYNNVANIRMELVTNNGKAFNGFTKSYGMFSGVNDYIGLIANKEDHDAAERIGYYGELVILHATIMGLGTCWVGGTFSRSNMPFSVAGNESVIGAIIVGNNDKDDSFKEKMIRNFSHRKSKSLKEMYSSDAPLPDWFTQGMEAVSKAPSAMHRQPVSFTYESGKVTAGVKDISGFLMAFDLGIAKLHFELGAGGGKWAWGNNGEFTHGIDS
ncbi:MAG: nitroreductase [Defluviitaleaceae bacterium]|nr:nitroreductase [Defluviitaleaceae bacterium]